MSAFMVVTGQGRSFRIVHCGLFRGTLASIDF
jgi:hypothetical protein